MELKSYQKDTINAVAKFCNYLQESPTPLTAWGRMKNENLVSGDYTAITKGIYNDLHIPNLCIKIPTAGGKTYTATKCLKEIMLKYRRQRTGLIMWVVPSEAIYSQTVKNFRSSVHHCRKALNEISPINNVIIREKFEDVKLEELENNLVVLVIVDKSIVEGDRKDFLKMHQENSNCLPFFPSIATAEEEENFAMQHPYLDFIQRNGEKTHYPVISKSNVIRLYEPIIVVDESHKNCTDISKKEIERLNPSFILQLSATPKTTSNIIHEVSARQLDAEQMIKLPIVLYNQGATDWQDTLTKSHEQLLELEAAAYKEFKQNKTYIRPMIIVRVESTGSDQTEKQTIHADDVKQYFIQTLNYKEHEVRLKTSDSNELKDEDLMSEYSKIKVIITKNALQEGWDCPFAYILTILDNPTQTNALTQFIGRIMRLPYAKKHHNNPLNKAYVFCRSSETHEIIRKIKNGLQKEGLGDFSADIEYQQSGENLFENSTMRQEHQKNAPYFFTTVMIEENSKKEPLSYRGHVLSAIKWDQMNPQQESANGKLQLDYKSTLLNSKISSTVTEIGADGKVEKQKTTTLQAKELTPHRIAKSLQDEIPNPWQAMRIAKEYLEKEKTDNGEHAITLQHEERIKDLITHNIESQCETIYKKMYEENIISLDIDTNNKDLQIGKGFTEKIKKGDRLKNKNGTDMQKSLLEPVNEVNYNKLERTIAVYLDKEFRILKWWYRIPVRSRFGLQGWKQQRIYPDFMALGRSGEIIYIESKGKHLKDNADTRYKEEVAKYLSTHEIEAKGTMTIRKGDKMMQAQVVIVHEEEIDDGIPRELEKINSPAV